LQVLIAAAWLLLGFVLLVICSHWYQMCSEFRAINGELMMRPRSFRRVSVGAIKNIGWKNR
jgi:hypothetical protein